MTLLVDYLEDAAAYLREKKERLKQLDQQYRKVYDRDLKKEMALVRQDIAKKSSEVTTELLYNLEEFRALHKYYPELLSAFMEDEYIGRIISKKAWLLDYRPVPPKDAAMKLEQLREWRAQLKDSKSFLRKWVGKVEPRSFIATYPMLRGHLTKPMDKDEALHVVDKVDKLLLKEGWLLLISDALIQIPIAKFMTHINRLRYEESQAEMGFAKARGRGTVAETAALRKLQELNRRRLHYERILVQVLLANPNHLRMLKKRKGWLSKEKAGNLDRIIRDITPHTIKERAWLNDMRRKLEGGN